MGRAATSSGAPRQRPWPALPGARWRAPPATEPQPERALAAMLGTLSQLGLASKRVSLRPTSCSVR